MYVLSSLTKGIISFANLAHKFSKRVSLNCLRTKPLAAPKKFQNEWETPKKFQKHSYEFTLPKSFQFKTIFGAAWSGVTGRTAFVSFSNAFRSSAGVSFRLYTSFNQFLRAPMVLKFILKWWINKHFQTRQNIFFFHTNVSKLCTHSVQISGLPEKYLASLPNPSIWISPK